MAANIAEFRQVVVLPTGAQVVLRILQLGDYEPLLAMFRCANVEDLSFFRDDVRDAALVRRWTEQINLAHVIPVVAVMQDRIVGEAMLQLGRGCDRHVAEVRIYLCHEFRGRGLGNLLIKALMAIGHELDLHILFVRIVQADSKGVRAFQSLGFKIEHVFTNRLMDPEGNTHDVVELAVCLKQANVVL
jgi:L-amino acid N-acyltransferase YncA